MAYAWNDGGFLPVDYDALWKLARARSKAAFLKGCDLVLAGFDVEEIAGEMKLKHTKMAAVYADKLELWMVKQKGGKSNKKRLLAIEEEAEGTGESQ